MRLAENIGLIGTNDRLHRIIKTIRKTMLTYRTQVKKDWIDYNGHMNVAYYYNAFEEAVLELWDFLGADQEYCLTTGRTFEITEGHIQFVAEAHLNEHLRIESEVFYVTQEGILVGQQMYRNEDLLCRFGQWDASVDITSREVTPLSSKILGKAERVWVGSDAELPDWIAGRVTMSKPR